MRRDEFKEGAEWAYRERRVLAGEAERVVLVAYPPKTKKVKIRRVEGELAGLDEWVTPTRLIVPWKQFPKRLREEQREKALLEHVERVGFPDSAVEDAISAVLESTGENLVWYRERHGCGHAPADALERLCDRAQIEPEERARMTAQPAFKDHEGTWMLPWPAMADLAQAITKAEPHVVTRYIHDQEESLRERAYQRGNEWAHSFLRDRLPGFAIARQWAGGRDDRVALLEEENRRLRGLVLRAIRYLDEAGERRKAGMLERDLGRD